MRIPALLLSLLAVAACDAATTEDPPALTFIHLNDTYRVDAVEEGLRGGFGRVATIVERLQAEGHDVRILHGGDFLFPSLESQLWNGEQMIEALNFLDALAPLYAVPGNHEFDRRTPEALIDAVRRSEFDWIGNNFRFATGADDVDARLEHGFRFTAGDRTIGIFGLTLHAEHGGNDRDYVPIDIDYAKSAERAIAALEAGGADLIVGLTHLHLADDIGVSKLKAKSPGFAFIAGGHEHEPEFEPGDAGSAMIVKGASNARTIWQIEVRFEGDEANIVARQIAVDASIPGNADYTMRVERKWRQRLLEKIPFLPATVGRAVVPLDAREVTIRNVESNWGNFIADQMLTAFGEPAADLAFINSGTLRIDDFIAADITFEDIGRTFGFSSFLRHLTLSGGDFRAVLEAGYRGTGPSKGYFPQIAGFRVCVDRRRPEGGRIVQLQLPGEGDWREIDADSDYLVVVPDFLYRGGDGYDFSNARDVSRPGSELQYLVLDAILVAQARGEAIGAPVDPENPRIAFVAQREDICF